MIGKIRIAIKGMYEERRGKLIEFYSNKFNVKIEKIKDCEHTLYKICQQEKEIYHQAVHALDQLKVFMQQEISTVYHELYNVEELYQLCSQQLQQKVVETVEVEPIRRKKNCFEQIINNDPVLLTETMQWVTRIKIAVECDAFLFHAVQPNTIDRGISAYIKSMKQNNNNAVLFEKLRECMKRELDVFQPLNPAPTEIISFVEAIRDKYTETKEFELWLALFKSVDRNAVRTWDNMRLHLSEYQESQVRKLFVGFLRQTQQIYEACTAKRISDQHCQAQYKEQSEVLQRFLQDIQNFFEKERKTNPPTANNFSNSNKMSDENNNNATPATEFKHSQLAVEEKKQENETKYDDILKKIEMDYVHEVTAVFERNENTIPESPNYDIFQNLSMQFKRQLSHLKANVHTAIQQAFPSEITFTLSFVIQTENPKIRSLLARIDEIEDNSLAAFAVTIWKKHDGTMQKSFQDSLRTTLSHRRAAIDRWKKIYDEWAFLYFGQDFKPTVRQNIEIEVNNVHRETLQKLAIMEVRAEQSAQHEAKVQRNEQLQQISDCVSTLVNGLENVRENIPANGFKNADFRESFMKNLRHMKFSALTNLQEICGRNPGFNGECVNAQERINTQFNTFLAEIPNVKVEQHAESAEEKQEEQKDYTTENLLLQINRLIACSN